MSFGLAGDHSVTDFLAVCNVFLIFDTAVICDCDTGRVICVLFGQESTAWRCCCCVACYRDYDCGVIAISRSALGE